MHRGNGQLCSIDDCVNAAERGGLCWAHLKRRSQGKTLNAPVRVAKYESRWECLTAAAIAYAHCDSEDDEEYKAVSDRLRVASLRYATKRTAEAPPRFNVVRNVIAARRAPRMMSGRQLKLFP